MSSPKRKRSGTPCYKQRKAPCIEDPDCNWIVGKGCKTNSAERRLKSPSCYKQRKADCVLSPNCQWIVGKGCRPLPKIQDAPKCKPKRKADCMASPHCTWIVGKGCRPAPVEAKVSRSNESLLNPVEEKSRSYDIEDEKYDCITRSHVPLKDIQRKAVEHFTDPNNNELLVAFGTGVGKTLTAVVISQCYLSTFPKSNVIVVSPKSLVHNFQQGMILYGADPFDPRFVFYTYTKFVNEMKKKNICKDKMLIIDEVHNIRNVKTVTFTQTMRCSQKASKRVFLTATPYINSIADVRNILSILVGHSISTGVDLRNELSGKVIYQPKIVDENFPQVHENDVEIQMSPEYLSMLLSDIADEDMWAHPERFYNGYRRVVNGIGDDYMSQKTKFIIDTINADRSKRNLIYSNWISHGVDRLVKTLKDYGIEGYFITGKVSAVERSRVVKAFNDGEFHTLFISAAGGEGLDLKGVENVFIMDPPWNPAGLEQVIGRAARYLSHAHMPLDKRHVHVYYLILVDNIDAKNSKSGDVILYNIIRNKRKEMNDFLELLEEVSI